MNNYMYNKEFLKVNGVDTVCSIDSFGEDTYKEILTVFVDEINDRINKLNESLNTNKLKDYATYVHAINGESGYLGFTALAKITLDHQLKAEANDIEFIKNNYQALMNELARVIRVSKIYLGQENFH